MLAACMILSVWLTSPVFASPPEPAAGRRAALGIEGPHRCSSLMASSRHAGWSCRDVVLHLHGATSVVEPALVGVRLADR